LSSDKKKVFSVSSDSSLKIFSTESSEQLRSYIVGDLALSCCALTPDEKTIIIGSWNNNIYSYSIDYGRVIDTLLSHDDAVSCLKLRGDILVSGSWDTTFKVFFLFF
jgi:factor associated with neutral sphingomyelinase activation